MSKVLKLCFVAILACVCQTNLSQVLRIAGVAPDLLIVFLVLLTSYTGAYGGFCTGALTAMRYICAAPLERLFSFHLGDDSAACLAQTVETYLLTQLERGFSALDFYKSLLIQQPESTYESE